MSVSYSHDQGSSLELILTAHGCLVVNQPLHSIVVSLGCSEVKRLHSFPTLALVDLYLGTNQSLHAIEVQVLTSVGHRSHALLILELQKSRLLLHNDLYIISSSSHHSGVKAGNLSVVNVSHIRSLFNEEIKVSSSAASCGVVHWSSHFIVEHVNVTINRKELLKYLSVRINACKVKRRHSKVISRFLGDIDRLELGQFLVLFVSLKNVEV